MCFVKKAVETTVVATPEPTKERKKADASLTKNSSTSQVGIKNNIKTSPQGLGEDTNSTRKTLLGE